MFERRQKMAVNLVRKQDDDTYRIVDDLEMFKLRATSTIVFEKAREDGKRIGSFYIQID